MVAPLTTPVYHYKINIINELGLIRRAIVLSVLVLLISTRGFGQLTIDFLAGNTNVCSGSAVTFTNNSMLASDTATYYWDFGAGASPAFATGIGPHVVNYTGSGPSTVSLTITDTSAHVLSKTDYITVFAIPAAPVVTVKDNCDTTSILSTTSPGILLWSTLEMSSAIIVKTAGGYTVTTTINGCTSSEGSGTATPGISPAFPVESVDCSRGFNKAVINILSPLGAEYEYRLDVGAYKNGTSFANVANGSHKISVINSSGCITEGDFFDVSCGCVDPATVTLSSTGGTTCALTPVTVSGNSFGGLADYVTITENGSGSVSPVMVTTSPFSFTYTPKIGDAGKTVIITVTTNNPLGAPCVAAKDTYTLIVDANPSAPTITKIVEPTCSEQTGSAEINGLPATGTWTITQSPGGIVTTGSGTGVTILNILPGTYTYTVANEAGCVSEPSSAVIIGPQPNTPAPPETGLITHPTCSISTGSVTLNGLPDTGTWTLMRSPGGVATPGNGTSKTISDLPAGTYTFTVIDSAGCTSGTSAAIIINPQPSNPFVPLIGTITPPTCLVSTGSVELTGLPVTGTWILTRYPGTVSLSGSGTSVTISGLTVGSYIFTVTTAQGCTSGISSEVSVPLQPGIPSANAGPDQVLENKYETSMEAQLDNELETGLWSVITGTAQFVDNTFAKTLVSGLSQGKNEFLWKVTSGGCPSAFDTVAITVNGFKIQTLITPNMDGRNDYFILPGLSTMGKTELVIFDRRGAEVYKNENYDNLWNGVDYNDKPLPDDTYFYTIRPENGKPLKGYIIIRR